MDIFAADGRLGVMTTDGASIRASIPHARMHAPRSVCTREGEEGRGAQEEASTVT